jgi:UPF0755 protein
MRRIRTFLLLIVIAALSVGGALWWEDRNFNAPGPSQKETVVIIRPGGGAGAIASSLTEAGVIDRPLLFRIGVRRRDRTTELKAGEYAFPAGASMAQVMDMLVEHKVLMHRITIAEGLTSGMALAILNADTVLEGPATTSPEGTLLPETYVFERGTTRAEMLERMRDSQKKLIDELWPRRKEGLPIQSIEDAIKLASIVEKETGLPEERPRIAAVFVNRLRMGMKLESDPTIIYGLTKGVPLGHPLRQSELDTPNPYSTYQITGLPPTPICNPGRDSIAAVLNPPESEDLFFVANGTGGHAFARTNAEHERNVAQWRRIEREQNRNE